MTLWDMLCCQGGRTPASLPTGSSASPRWGLKLLLPHGGHLKGDILYHQVSASSDFTGGRVHLDVSSIRHTPSGHAHL